MVLSVLQVSPPVLSDHQGLAKPVSERLFILALLFSLLPPGVSIAQFVLWYSLDEARSP